MADTLSLSTTDTQPIASSTTSPRTANTLTSITALARFEFELHRGNEGTKILMIEWRDEDESRHNNKGQWQISWPGKRTTFAAEDNTNNTNRRYFLLLPGETVPQHVSIVYHHHHTPPSNTIDENNNNNRKEQTTLQTTLTPLPAIFTPELGVSSKTCGRKGVLHTIWAKHRLQVLDREIEYESETNMEGIALDMALSEKKWIHENFGLAQTSSVSRRPAPLDVSRTTGTGTANGPISPSLQSPRTPGGRRLTDKLKGLSLMTSPDTTLPSTSSSTSTSTDTKTDLRSDPSTRRIVPLSPPTALQSQQAQTTSSLSSIAQNTIPAPTPITRPDRPTREESNEEQDLFAVAMSPRSPDEPRSPFSLVGEDEDGPGHGLQGGAFARIKGLR